MTNKILKTKFKIIYLSIVLPLLFLLDQLSKQWASLNLEGKGAIEFFGGLFQLVYARNTGAFLGMGGEMPREVRFVAFTLIVVIGLGGMLWYLIKKEHSRLNLVAYSFIVAGGLGNLYDRIFNPNGFVTDFLFIQLYGPFRTGVFNVADVHIVIGFLLAIYKEYYDRKSKRSLSLNIS